jgi:hypothetical protein
MKRSGKTSTAFLSRGPTGSEDGFAHHIEVLKAEHKEGRVSRTRAGDEQESTIRLAGETCKKADAVMSPDSCEDRAGYGSVEPNLHMDARVVVEMFWHADGRCVFCARRERAGLECEALDPIARVGRREPAGEGPVSFSENRGRRFCEAAFPFNQSIAKPGGCARDNSAR